MLDKISYVAGNIDMHAFIIPAISFIALLTNGYNEHTYSYIIFMFHKHGKLTSGSGANFEKYKI
jgi:hypothetical protein